MWYFLMALHETARLSLVNEWCKTIASGIMPDPVRWELGYARNICNVDITAYMHGEMAKNKRLGRVVSQ